MFKSQVFVAHSFWVICRNVSCTFVEHCMERPYWCTILVHQYGLRKSTKHLKFTFSIKALSCDSGTSIRAHKHIFWYLKWLYYWKSRGEMSLYTLWKPGSSHCCIFEMKHAMRMETCTKIYFLFIFNLELIRIHKTMLFWLYNLMMSLWRPSILVQVWIKNESIILFLKLPSWTCSCVLHR